MTRRESGFRVERWTSFSEISFEGDFHRQDKKETETSSKSRNFVHAVSSKTNSSTVAVDL